MAYKKTEWINNETALSADNMNHIEDGISDIDNKINNSFGIDEAGNVSVKKDLDIIGATKLMNGFKPLHIYKMYDRSDEVEYTIEVWFEVPYNSNDNYSKECSFIGKYYASDGTGPSYLVYGDYILIGETDNLSYLTAFIIYNYTRFW